MSDDQEFDLCECVFSHEFAMRRLLSLLRNGQTSCTDNECTDLMPSQQNTAGGESADNFTFMMFMMIAAVILYLIRPSSLRRRNNDGLAKPSRDNDSNDNDNDRNTPPSVN